ncbi:hypothetical protein HJC23_011577 [Cyclotella cryptica]|uniref:Uncharacterized protein n=1 Tax=Cyclotella cryptica TaxID=29204 RepID=A0ABD3QRY9_9STRA
MGRVARYKKVKSVDPFAKARSWTDGVGDASNLRRVKKRSKTAQKLKEQKNNKLQRRLRGKSLEKKKRGGSNGWGDDDGFDLPPDGEDEFEINDMLGSIKKQRAKANDLLNDKSTNPNQMSTTFGAHAEKLSHKVEKVDLRGVSMGSKQPETQRSSAQSKTADVVAKANSNSSEITAKTPTREIIAACSNPKSQQQSVDGTTSKQAKRKAFFEQKKLKKRKRDKNDDYEEDDTYIYDRNSSQTKKTKAQSHNISPKAPVARCILDDQVERPPIFSALPRGAVALSKMKKLTTAEKKCENEEEKVDRIRKEQQALEAMRERVMKQYAILRESRRK